MKICNKCKTEKIEEEFYKYKNGKFHSVCKQCQKEYRIDYYLKNTEKILDKNKIYYNRHTEEIKKYRNKYYSENFSKIKKQMAEYGAKYYKTRIKIYKEIYMFRRARARAKKKGLDFNIEEIDIKIPDFCPLLGIPIYSNETRLNDNSPTLDRIDNSKGYIKGNIIVISWKANRIKSDSNINEFGLIYENWKKLLENNNY